MNWQRSKNGSFSIGCGPQGRVFRQSLDRWPDVVDRGLCVQEQNNTSRRLRWIAALIAGAYTILAAAWMLGAFLTSDALTREQVIEARVIKDSIFILLSGSVLYSVIYKTMRRI